MPYDEKKYDVPAGLEDIKLPYSLEAEQSVLGSILIDPQSLYDVLGIVKPYYFYLPQHREIFNSMVRMFGQSNAIDAVTLLEDLKRSGVYDEAGGKAYLLQLAQIVPSVANVVAYARIVQEKYYLRSLISASKEIISAASAESDDVRAIMDAAEQKIYDIRQDKLTDELRPIKDVILETYDRLLKMSGEDKDKYLGLSTGFSDLDRMTTA